MSRKKAFEIADIQVIFDCSSSNDISVPLADALYASAKGTKHFYEALELIAYCFPDTGYSDEFEELKQKSLTG